MILPIPRRMRPLLSPLLFPALLLALGTTARAQQLTTTSATADSSSLDSSLPDSPAPQTTPPPEHTDQQTTRILAILPNFRAVSADQHLPPQTVKDKFITATQDSFDYSSIFLPVTVAGYNQLTNKTPEFGTGGVAYARYLWHSAVDQTSENYFVEFIVPTITHEDNRYYTLGHGSFWHRSGYALSRAVVTRSDSGHDTFNISEVIGAGAAAGISNLYYPRPERTLGNTGSQWGTSIGIDAAAFLVKEFWPDINHSLFHNKNTVKDTNPAH